MSKSLASIVVVCFLFLIPTLLLGCGTPSQKVVESSGTGTKVKPSQDLVLESVGFVPASPEFSPTSYFVIGKMVNNNSTYACEGAPIIASLYDDQGTVLGSNNSTLAALYPNSYRWYVSERIDAGGQKPARADLKITTQGFWKKTAQKKSPFEVTQKNYLPGQYTSKITGVFHYSGTPLSPKDLLKAVAVLLDANGNAIGADTGDISNVTTSGDYPFEISVSSYPGVANMDVQVIETGYHYI